MGDKSEALRAGATPKIMPTDEETPKANRTELRVTFAGKKLLIIWVMPAPKITPKIPPKQARITASNKN